MTDRPTDWLILNVLLLLRYSSCVMTFPVMKLLCDGMCTLRPQGSRREAEYLILASIHVEVITLFHLFMEIKF